jgi:fatty-acyl-CoA synthase
VSTLIGDVLADAAALRPGAQAATLGEQALTFTEADRAANRTAHALAGHGVGNGDIVAWWTSGDLRSLDGCIGLARLGGVFAPLSPLLSPEEAGPVLEYLAPRLVVVDGERADAGAELCRRLGLPVAQLADLGPGAAESAPVPRRPVRESDPHIIYLTSGTTGRSKGVVVSHRASWMRSFPGGGTFSLGLQGRPGGILDSFPLYHYGGWQWVLEAWLGKRAVHLVRRADAGHLIDAIERWRPSGMYCIPAVWRRVLDGAGPELDMTCIHQADSGTSATPLEFLLRLKERLPHATTSVFYGSSEAGHSTTLADWDVVRKPGSVGLVAPPQLLRLADDGEVCVRGDTLMDGYLRLPEETAAAVQDGWYHTGDLGHLDDEGYLFVTGRKREVIRSGGETVAPVEVEAALAGLPGVRELAVVGMADDTWGEVVCAAVVVADGAPTPTVEEVRSHLAERLAAYKHPRRVVAVASIPRTSATGQVQRTLLKETLQLRHDD